MDISDEVRDFASDVCGERGDITRLAGDASTRAYYRVTLKRGTVRCRTSAVIMQLPEPDPDPVFISVQKLLHSIDSPVPEIFDMDLSRGLVLLEDFGDVTLEQAVSGADRDAWIELYTRAINIMLDIQLRGAERRHDSDCVCFSLAFDVEKLLFEMDFFIEHALKNFKGIVFRPGAEAALREEFVRLCAVLAAQPRFLCHRDYHSRNLMVLPGGALGVIDFQDARMGPLQYDLVSLLHDSYVDMPGDIRDELAAMYEDRIRDALPHFDETEFDFIYDAMLVQRNIKAAGSFAYLDCVKKMGRYLQRFDVCLSHVKKAFSRMPDFETLHGMLCEYLPELR
jgi:hypothetical protein